MAKLMDRSTDGATAYGAAPAMYLTQTLHRALRIKPDEIISIDGTRRRTWREFADRVARTASALQALGLGTGGRVAILARNGDYFLDFIFGVIWAGGVINPVNTRWSVPEISYSLENSQSDILLLDPHFLPMLENIRAQTPCLRHVVLLGEQAAPGLPHLETLLRESPPVADAVRAGDDLAAILYTGGTSGKAKGVMLSHRNLFTSSLAAAASPDCAPRGVMMHTAPLFHVGAIGGLITIMLSAGRHVFVPGFEPGAVLAGIAAHGVTDIFLVPTMLQALLDHPSFDTHELGSLQRIFYGAAPMTATLIDRAIERLPQVGFVQGYGMTELSPLATQLSPSDHGPHGRATGRMNSAGRPVATVEIRIVNPQDEEVPIGETGEIVVRGENVMRGYWDMPEVTAAALKDGWMHTGDIGRVDSGGYVYVVDRLKDMIISGGENVFSTEVENALSSHPGVSQCAVIGIPDAVWGETVHAVIVARAGAEPDAASLIAHCRQSISGYKCPRSVEFRDSMPLSAAGKILKNELRKQITGKAA